MNNLLSKNTLSWLLASCLTLVLIGSAAAKLLSTPETPIFQSFLIWGLIEYINPIAYLEIISALLFLLPLTSSVGTLLLTAFFGGAISIHLANGESLVVPAVFLILIWITNYLRNPRMMKSFHKKKSNINELQQA